MSVLAVVVAVGLGSYLMRLVPLLAGRLITPAAERGLAAAGTAALTALITTDVTSPPRWHLTVATAMAIVTGALIAWRGRSMPFVIAGGVAVHALVAAGLAATIA